MYSSLSLRLSDVTGFVKNHYIGLWLSLDKKKKQHFLAYERKRSHMAKSLSNKTKS